MPKRSARILVFDPEGSGFDEATARAFGMTRDMQGHLGSVVPSTTEQQRQFRLPPESFMLLKGKQHPTFDKAVEAEERRGFTVIKRGNRYFSIPRRRNRFVR